MLQDKQNSILEFRPKMANIFLLVYNGHCGKTKTVQEEQKRRQITICIPRIQLTDWSAGWMRTGCFLQRYFRRCCPWHLRGAAKLLLSAEFSLKANYCGMCCSRSRLAVVGHVVSRNGLGRVWPREGWVQLAKSNMADEESRNHKTKRAREVEESDGESMSQSSESEDSSEDSDLEEAEVGIVLDLIGPFSISLRLHESVS